MSTIVTLGAVLFLLISTLPGTAGEVLHASPGCDKEGPYRDWGCTRLYDEGEYECCDREPDIDKTTFSCFAGRSDNGEEHFRRYKICLRKDHSDKYDSFVEAAVRVYKNLIEFGGPGHLAIRYQDGGDLIFMKIPPCYLPYRSPRFESQKWKMAWICVDGWAS